MSEKMATFIACMLGPRLNSFYKLTGNTLNTTTPQVLSRSHRYNPSSIETITDHVVTSTSILASLSAYLSPILISYFVYNRKTIFAASSAHYDMMQLMATAFTIFAASYCIRGYARYTNQDYVTFLRVLQETLTNPNASNKRVLAHFDADFSAYPVDYKWSEAANAQPLGSYRSTVPARANEPTLALDRFVLKLPLEVVISIIMKVIGRRLIYPGSLAVIQTIMGPAINTGRARLIEECHGVRHKLESSTGNYVDAMFVDRRGSTPNGDFLVIGCEGNGGFYEIGTILTPLEAGYSVLGWNHPGFGGSTGVPYPDQDVASVDVVINFAIDKLNFTPNKIIIYGWSIGGFTATWAGMRHPRLHGIVVDASFDHILPLAARIFPPFAYSIIEFAIRKHFDLDCSRHMENYKGPVLLIRRSQDEVISLDPFNSPPTNRANDLLIDILKQRFPELLDSRAERLTREYLGGNARYQDTILKRYAVNNTSCSKLLMDYFHTNPTSYPIKIGPELDMTSRDQLTLFLASKFMIDYDSVHCAPLPDRYFRRPWDLIGLALNSSNL